MKEKVMLVLLAIVLVASLVGFGACAAPPEKAMPPEEEKAPPEEEKAPPVEGALEVVFREVQPEPSVILEVRKGDEVLLKVKALSTAEPGDLITAEAWNEVQAKTRFTSYTAVWVPQLGEYYWYGFADWVEQSPQYTFGFAAPYADVGNYNSSLSNTSDTVFVSADGSDIEWQNKGDYLGLMKKLGEAMEEIGSPSEITNLLQEEVPGLSPELLIQQERFLSKVKASSYDKALANLASNLPYPISELDEPRNIILEAGALILGTAADLTSPNPLVGVCALATMQPISESISEVELQEALFPSDEEEAVIEVMFRDVEAEPSVILELKKGDDVVLKVMETLLVEPTLTYYTAMWTPDLGQYYWYAYAEWHKELPQYTFGFAMTAAADIGNHNTSRSNKVGNVIVSPDGDNIEWTDKEDYLELMKKLSEAMEEIGSREDIIRLLDREVPGSASELIAKQERILDKVSSSDYDEALAQAADNLPHQGTELRNPGDVTYEELERVVQAIEASVIVIGTAADLASPNPIAGACFATGNKGGFAIGGFNAA